MTSFILKKTVDLVGGKVSAGFPGVSERGWDGSLIEGEDKAFVLRLYLNIKYTFLK